MELDPRVPRAFDLKPLDRFVLLGVAPEGEKYDNGRNGVRKSMNRVEKVTVSLPREHLRTVRRALKRRGGTMSGYVATALAAYEKQDELRALLDDLDRELGEPSMKAKRWAQRALK
jgi:hypothetical protein